MSEIFHPKKDAITLHFNFKQNQNSKRYNSISSGSKEETTELPENDLNQLYQMVQKLLGPLRKTA